MRALSSGDLDKALQHLSSDSSYRLPGWFFFYDVTVIL